MNGPTERLRALTPAVLAQIRRGIEKESLRVRPDGALSLAPHPVALGSPLTHPHITTDFSESQLELITGVHTAVDACLAELTRIHQFVYKALPEGELLWGSSMPCNLPGDDDIPIGRYGRSNIGRMKTIYRTGLSHRYGRRMQTISGIHYNFSLPGLVSEDYFALIRNFRRHSWLPLYLFGASPAVCSTFVAGRTHELRELARGTLYLPHATSLRMGRLGYQSDAQAALCVSYNNLDNYAASLDAALTRPFPAYERIGVRKGDEYLQLNTTLLQIENEFYSTVRPKRRTRPGERPLHALRERGVEYVEVRLMDLDPFEAVGIHPQTMRLLDVLLLHCHLGESPPDTLQEIAAIGRNQHLVAARGREPGLSLTRFGKPARLADWAGEILAECEPIAAALDAAQGGGAAHAEAVAHARKLVADASLTPSARVLDAMARNHQDVYVRFALAQSLLHAGYLRGLAFPEEARRFFENLAAKSLAEQEKIEASDTLDFESYRRKYLAHDTLIIGQPRYREDR
ncbi:MAG: glutamate--cysteine ligase [Betaproteobacteria bacterium]|nr:glutamate--cysteine ligase [Betaproteobacteria bacterium]